MILHPSYQCCCWDVHLIGDAFGMARLHQGPLTPEIQNMTEASKNMKEITRDVAQKSRVLCHGSPHNRGVCANSLSVHSHGMQLIAGKTTSSFKASWTRKDGRQLLVSCLLARSSATSLGGEERRRRELSQRGGPTWLGLSQ